MFNMPLYLALRSIGYSPAKAFKKAQQSRLAVHRE